MLKNISKTIVYFCTIIGASTFPPRQEDIVLCLESQNETTIISFKYSVFKKILEYEEERESSKTQESQQNDDSGRNFRFVSFDEFGNVVDHRKKIFNNNLDPLYTNPSFDVQENYFLNIEMKLNISVIRTISTCEIKTIKIINKEDEESCFFIFKCDKVLTPVLFFLKINDEFVFKCDGEDRKFDCFCSGFSINFESFDKFTKYMKSKQPFECFDLFCYTNGIGFVKIVFEEGEFEKFICLLFNKKLIGSEVEILSTKAEDSDAVSLNPMRKIMGNKKLFFGVIVMLFLLLGFLVFMAYNRFLKPKQTV